MKYLFKLDFMQSPFSSAFARATLLSAGIATLAGHEDPRPPVHKNESVTTTQISPESSVDLPRNWRDYPSQVRTFLDNAPLINNKDNAPLTQASHVALVFINTNCPLAARSIDKLNSLQQQFAQSINLRIVAVFSRQNDDAEKIAAFKEKYDAKIALLRDERHLLADMLHAERSPEVFLLDARCKIIYRGAIDDGQQAKGTTAVRNDFLSEVLTSLRDHLPIEHTITDAEGCFIDRPNLTQIYPTFNRDIGPLVETHCTYCHRPGDVGSVIPLTDIGEISDSAHTLSERVSDRYMPPWRPDLRYGQFSNESALDVNEIWAFRKWAERNTPQGSENSPYQIAAQSTSEIQRLADPDALVHMTEDGAENLYYTVPKKSDLEGLEDLPYQHFIVKTDFGEDKWLIASEVRAMAPEVVHHINVFIVKEDDSLVTRSAFANRMAKAYAQRELGIDHKEFDHVYKLYGAGMRRQLFLIGNYTPSHTALRFSEEHGVLIPRGAEIIFECHYTPNGTETKDRSALALKFADRVPENAFGKQAITRSGAPSLRQLKIEPNGEKELTRTLTFFADAELMSLRPHMHLRGRDFSAYIERPGETPERILYIPSWDYQWQIVYNFKKPVQLPEGTKLHMTYRWDNTANNKLNPNPESSVRFGTKIQNEMGMAWPTYSYLNPDEAEYAEELLERALVNNDQANGASSDEDDRKRQPAAE